MKAKQVTLFLLLQLLISIVSIGQNTVNTVFEDGRTIYVSERTMTLSLNTSGWGINYRSARYTSGTYKLYWNFGFTSIKSLKESAIGQTSLFLPSLVFGKINSIISLKVGKGFQKIFLKKQNKESIEVSYLVSGGASIIYAKPIFVEVSKISFNPTPPRVSITEKVERYDPNIHPIERINKTSLWTVGLFNGSFIPSVYAKAGIVFEYSLLANKVSALELGVTADLSYKKVPIFYEDSQNSFYFINLYVAISFGSKTER